MIREEHDMPDPWRLLKRFPGMSKIGRAIMGKKLDRAAAIVLRDRPGLASITREVYDGIAIAATQDINRLACTAAKNW